VKNWFALSKTKLRFLEVCAFHKLVSEFTNMVLLTKHQVEKQKLLTLENLVQFMLYILATNSRALSLRLSESFHQKFIFRLQASKLFGSGHGYNMFFAAGQHEHKKVQ